jgi:chorismate mutase
MFRVLVQEGIGYDSMAAYTCRERPTFEAVAIAVKYEDGTEQEFPTIIRFVVFTPQNGNDRGMEHHVLVEKVVAITSAVQQTEHGETPFS